MRRIRRTRRFVPALLALMLLASVTVLFGAGQSARVTAPAHKAKVSGVIDVKAEVANVESVAYVVLVVDGQRPASSNAAPCSFELDTRDLTDGPHSVSIEAYDSRGLMSASKAITIYVKNQQPVPVVIAKQPHPSKATAAKPAPKASARATAPTVASLAPAPVETAVSTPEPVSPPATTAAPVAPPAPMALLSAIPVRIPADIAPVTTLRGPAPEPTRTAALVTVTPRSARTAEATALSAAAAAPGSVSPPMAKLATPAPRQGYVVIVDGKPVAASVTPGVSDGRIHSAFRDLFESVGAHISWAPDARTARGATESLVVEVPIGSRLAKVNGADMDMGAVATIESGRTVVPVRFFAQATGSTISWEAGAAHVQTPKRSVASEK